MLSLFLSPFVVLNIMTSYVSLNVVESETFQNKRKEEVGWRGDVFKYESRFLMLTEKESWRGEGQAFIPLLKLHLYFTDVTEDRLLYFLFQMKRVHHASLMCVGIF